MARSRRPVGISIYHKAVSSHCQWRVSGISFQWYGFLLSCTHFLLIDVEGTSITVFGTTPIASGPETVASIEFLIDGVHNSTFIGLQSAGIIRHTPFLHVEGLSDTREHTVTMNTLTSNWWYLDYMVYTTRNSAIAGGGGSQGSQDTGGGTSPNVGAIVGGVVAGVFVLVGLLALAFIVARRRRAQRDLADPRPVTGLVSGPLIAPSNRAHTPAYGPKFQNIHHVPTGSSMPFLSTSGSPVDSSVYTGYSNGQLVGSPHTETASSSPQPISVVQGIAYR
jgi:hypothetical protein